MSWPSISRPNYIGPSEYYKKQHKSTFETGTVISRPAHTSGKNKWTLQWNAMTQADLNSLISAFETDLGSTFSWTHPLTSTVYTVGYASDKIKHELDAKKYNRYQVSVELEER